ncbi:hypothetical protein I4U23_005184 [Adineta vaga]|nr:hypothetical protein I4U23_005184 [Adineta vaga]
MFQTISTLSATVPDECSICLTALSPGLPLLTLSCNHKFHLECFALNLKAKHRQCPLCRTTVDSTVNKILIGENVEENSQNERAFIETNQSRHRLPLSVRLDRRSSRRVTNNIISVEDPVDEIALRTVSNQLTNTLSNSHILPSIIVSTTLEFNGQLSNQESTMYGLVTLEAPSNSSSTNAHAPIDIICLVDQSSSMKGRRMILLKQTLIYIAERLNEFDRLAIVSFDKRAFDRSHNFKRMNQQNLETMKKVIHDNIQIGNGTCIGSGLEMAINLFVNRRTKNPLSALLLFTDGEDRRPCDYSQLMSKLPENTICHTFGYGREHSSDLLLKLAELGNGGTFTYIDKHEAIGPAFASTMAGLLTCVAQQIRVNIEFSQEYQVIQTHSHYEYEPEQLPSSKVIFKLNDLNANEKRNLLFQLYTPKIMDTSATKIIGKKYFNIKSNKESQHNQHDVNKHIIGHVSITYIEPESRNTLNTVSVPFHLVRSSFLTSELCRINRKVDIQRNRVRTAMVLKQAMNENNYDRSLSILKNQVKSIQRSASARHPFCQQLVKDLKYQYPSEEEYRSSQSNACLQHLSERSTYTTERCQSAKSYQSPQQQLEIEHFNMNYTKKS